MDLQTLIQRTGLPSRMARYVADHDLVGTGRIRAAENEVGRPRRFADDVGVGIALGAHLLKGGVKRQTVERLMMVLPRIRFSGKGPSVLQSVLSSHSQAIVEIGDGRYVRFSLEEWESGWKPLDSSWKAPANYEPHVVIRVDIGRIRDQVLGFDEE